MDRDFTGKKWSCIIESASVCHMSLFQASLMSIGNGEWRMENGECFSRRPSFFRAIGAMLADRNPVIKLGVII